MPPSSLEDFHLFTPPQKERGQNSEQVKETLDKHLVLLLSTLDQYTSHHQQLQSKLQMAFFNLAKAKTILGPSRIGPNSYDLTPRLPINTVTLSHAEGLREAPAQSDALDILDKYPFNLLASNRGVHHDSTGHNPPKVSSSDSAHSAGDSALRKRSTNKHPQTDKPSLAEGKVSKSALEKLEKIEKLEKLGNNEKEEECCPQAFPEPILQFSALPPPPLRTSQAQFAQSLELMVRLANLRFAIREFEKLIILNLSGKTVEDALNL